LAESAWGVGKAPQRRKRLGTPQNPQRQVHALLGNLPTRTMAKKKTPPQTRQDFTRDFDFYQNQINCDLPKRLLKKWILPNKTTNKPERQFWKTRHNQKITTPTKPR